MPQDQADKTGAANKSEVLEYAPKNMPSMLAVVWCRILALWMLSWGLYTSIPALVAMCGYILTSSGSNQRFGENAAELFIWGLPGIIWLSMAWYCWRKAPAIALRMTSVRAEGPSEFVSNMTVTELLHVLLMVIGVFLLSTGLPSIAQWAFDKVGAMRNAQAQTVSPQFWTAIARCALGLWLILGTRGIVVLLRRHGGKWRDESKSPSSE